GQSAGGLRPERGTVRRRRGAAGGLAAFTAPPLPLHVDRDRLRVLLRRAHVHADPRADAGVAAEAGTADADVDAAAARAAGHALQQDAVRAQARGLTAQFGHHRVEFVLLAVGERPA